MEDIAGGNTAELQKSCNSKNTDGHSTLKKFTIPRKKRNLEKALLEECPKESREYSYIHSTLNDSRLDITYEIFPPWECQDVKLVHNEDLAREFSEKRFEMRSKGRHGREMEERFCFLVTSIKGAAQLYENGVKTCKTGPYTLGNPLYGVYLFRHVDVALKRAMKKSAAPKTIVIFKALFGKVKRVKSCVGKMVDQDPTIHFDCFMSKDPISHKDTLSQQALGSFAQWNAGKDALWLREEEEERTPPLHLSIMAPQNIMWF
nr:PREDICTED: protein TASOR-like [Lepisosteus oculatus]